MNTMKTASENKACHPGGEFFQILTQVAALVEWFQTCGIDGVFHQAPSRASSVPLTLEALQKALQGCQRCKLHAGRTHIVFGAGHPQAELMFIGEAPGYDEDREGEPFVGDAGKLLTKIIEAMGLRREDVYMTNIVKCHPPRNRDPQPDEIAQCEPFLRQQIAHIHPKVICALGRVAAHTLLHTTTSISRLRGTWYDYHGIPVMPTYHPAYLLRTPEDKRLVWQDMQMIQLVLTSSA